MMDRGYKAPVAIASSQTAPEVPAAGAHCS
uniref:Uncharacterized protein n=1 Tax=Arundo donax TaxID=35708 RepID=A0A0A9BY10_ARUDO